MLSKIEGIFSAIFAFFKTIGATVVKFVFDLAFRVFDLFLPLERVALFVKRRLPSLWTWFTSIAWVKRTISRGVFRKFGRIAPARPHPFTMAASYTTWEGAVDRNYTGRHLPVPDPRSKPSQPDSGKIVDLFLRETDAGNQTDCIRSSFMFAAFAQWFTDSFLRTAHMFKYDCKGNVVRDANGFPVRELGREKYNTSNHEIDLCQIYGLTEEQTDILRLGCETDRGCLRFEEHDDGEFPPFLLAHKPADPGDKLDFRDGFEKLHPDERILRSIFLRADHNEDGYETIFATGLEHSNATLGNALLNTIFLREHNRVARKIAAGNPDWDDERVFQTTRNVMIVLLLKIVISDYIRHISPLSLPLEFQPGLADNEKWNRTNRISIEFNLLYRWHGLVPDRFPFLPKPDDPLAFRHNNGWLLNTGVGKAVSLFSDVAAGKIIIGNTPRFLGPVKHDSVALMRAADLASYNDYRERFSLPRMTSFEDISDDPEVVKKLHTLYGGNVDAVEWYVGLFAEKHTPDAIMSELMLNMVAHDAFTQALTNPLLSENVFNPKTFSQVGWDIITETSTLDHIVQRVVKPDQSVKCSFARADQST